MTKLITKKERLRQIQLVFYPTIFSFFFILFITSYVHSSLMQKLDIATIIWIDKVNQKIENTTGHSSETLDQFVSLQLKHWQQNPSEIEKTGVKFNLLTEEKIIGANFKENLGDYYKKKQQLNKMKVLAYYISTNYNKPLNEIEKIVLHSFNEAEKRKIEPLLVLSVIGVESTYKTDVRSSAGAIGLTQVIPRWHHDKIKKLTPNGDLWGIENNIKVGSEVLKEYVDKSNGNVRKALQMYNGSLSDDTYKYSNKVFAKMNKLKKVINQNNE